MPPGIVLLPLALIYGLVIRIRNFLFDTGLFPVYKLPAIVISIGNLTTGGTGKTPFAEMLIRYFTEKGMKTAYLSRGYGRKTKGYLLVDLENGNAESFGDEACQVAGKFPEVQVAVCENRVRGALSLIKTFRSEVIILDDAFQHRRIFRNMDIVLIDASRLPQNEQLIPAGRLREPFSSIQRADFVVVNKVQEINDIDRISKNFGKISPAFTRVEPGQVFSFFDKKGTSVSELKGQPCIGFSGLGNNKHFRETLENLNLEVRNFLSFPDHFTYQRFSLLRIISAWKKSGGNDNKVLILTTEKDFFRLKSLPLFHELQQYPLFFITIQIQWLKGRDTLDTKLNQLVYDFKRGPRGGSSLHQEILPGQS